MDAFEQDGSRFVGGVLGNEFVRKGAGEACHVMATRRGKQRRDPAAARRSSFQPRFNLVGQREQDAVKVFGL